MFILKLSMYIILYALNKFIEQFSNPPTPGKLCASNIKNKYRRKKNNHTCETIRLLQELHEDPICACYEQDDDDDDDSIEVCEFF